MSFCSLSATGFQISAKCIDVILVQPYGAIVPRTWEKYPRGYGEVAQTPTGFREGLDAWCKLGVEADHMSWPWKRFRHRQHNLFRNLVPSQIYWLFYFYSFLTLLYIFQTFPRVVLWGDEPLDLSSTSDSSSIGSGSAVSAGSTRSEQAVVDGRWSWLEKCPHVAEIPKSMLHLGGLKWRSAQSQFPLPRMPNQFLLHFYSVQKAVLWEQLHVPLTWMKNWKWPPVQKSGVCHFDSVNHFIFRVTATRYHHVTSKSISQQQGHADSIITFTNHIIHMIHKRSKTIDDWKTEEDSVGTTT